MERIYHHYNKWEDYHNGLYHTTQVDNIEELVGRCADLLKNCDAFYLVMINVVKEWRIASEVNLTNISRNRQAWLGQSSCCYKYKAPEYVTKLAWRTLTKEQQDKANDTADRIIYEWGKIYINGDQRTLFNYA